MRLALAALLAATVSLGAPAFAAAPATNAPTAPPGVSGEAPPAVAPAAPVPDPFFAEMLKTCRDGASGDAGTVARLTAAGWLLTVDGDTQTPFYQAYNGLRDFDGIGTVELTYSLEVYPTLTEGYCSVSVDAPERLIGIADMKKLPGFKGQYRETADGVASTWQDDAAQPTTFIQVDQHAGDLYFILDVTTLMARPAVDIPYVQPAAPGPGPDDTNPDDTNGGGSDSPSAANPAN